jgi:DNA-binding SARP family transcriptional activator/tetratricopeptide (TPR) repeat protein
MDAEFCLLGPLQVRCGGELVRIPSGKQRAVLAALLLQPNRVVTADELVDVMWGTTPPPTARAALHNCVKRLRDSLGLALRARISTEPSGYMITLRDGELDVACFEAKLHEARAAAKAASWDAAAGQARAALALWRGQPLADLASEVLAVREAGRLTELRLQAAETYLGAMLDLGQHSEVIEELRRLVADAPLREHFHALLMTALYRDGRQAEALAAFQHARGVFVAELGAEPGPELQQLQQRILAAELAPAAPVPVAAAGQTTRHVVPRELPGPVRHFTGRAAELAELSDLAAGGGRALVICAVDGTAGVGKTALAIQWAHQVAGRFPDGQLYVNLRGYDPGEPVLAADALAGLLRTLGVPGEEIPGETEERARLYRSRLAGRRMLVLLDNARDADQVRPLLPGTPGCAVLVTSRDALAGLVARDGAARLDLDLLPLDDAVALLTELIGEPARADPAAAAELARCCARLPLALRVAAELAAARPAVPLTGLVADLAGQQKLLDLLDAGDDPRTAVRAVFSWSYRQLSDEPARMFRLLGLHPGPDITVPAAASLAALAEADARRLLQGLSRAHLIAEHVPGRYAFHDLLRAYAAEKARHIDSDGDRREATGRVLDHYLHTAAGAARLLVPTMEPVILALPQPGAGASKRPADHREALAWYEAEHQVLLAAIALAARSGFDSHAWQLPWAIAHFLQTRGHWQEWAATQRTALDAATRLGDTAAQAVSGRLLAKACTDLGDHDQARGHYASSLRLYQRLGNPLGEAKIQHSLGLAAERQGRFVDALGHAEQALRLYQAIGDKANEAEALNNVGWYQGLLGDYQQARAFCRQTLTLSSEAGNRWIEGHAWDSLGYAEHHLGNLAEAAACYQRALSLHREAGDRFSEAGTLTHLGETRHAAGQPAQARQAWQQALAILEDLQHPDAGEVRARLASTNGDASPNPSA